MSLVGTTFSNTGVLSVGASGALTSSGGQNPAITLATTSDLTQLGSQLGLTDTGVTAGSYNNVTVDAKGRVTGASNISYLTSETDGVIGNEVADVALNGGLVMTGAGTSVSPYKVGLITTCADNQLLKYTSAGGWACANDIDTDTNTDSQTLTWNTGTNSLSISGGNSVDLSSLLDNTDSQALGLAGNTLSLTNGGSVDLSGYLDNTDSQTLSWNGGTRTLSLTNGGSVVISDADTTYSAGTGITLTGTTFSLTNDFGSSIDSSEITNGTIAAADLANSGATAGTYGDTGVNVAQLTVNAQGQVTSISNRALPTANTTTTGVLSNTDWNTFNGKENVLTFTGNGLFSRAGNTITGIAGTVSGQVLKWNGSAWATGTDNDTTYTNGNGLSLASTTFSINAPTCAGTTKLQWDGSAFLCSADVDTDTDTTNFNIRANAGVSANIAAGNTISFVDGTGTSASRSSNDVSFSLTNVGTAGTYGSATAVPVITTDAQGRVTGVTSTPINFPAEVDGVIGNEVTNATANGGLTRSGSGTSGSPYTLGLLTTCGDQQVLKYTLGTTTWGCANDNNTTYTNGTGISLVGNTFSLTNDFGASIDSSEITNGTVATADLAAPSASNNTTFGDSGVNVTNITVNDKGQVVSIANRALPTANGTTTGVLSSGDWNTFNGKENVLTFTGNGLFNRVGDTITGIAGTVSGQVLKWNGSAWATGTDNDTTYSNGNGLSLSTGTFSINAPTCAGTTKLQWNGSAFLCSADVDTDTDTTNFNIRANAGASANIAAGNTVSFVDGTGTSASRSTNDISFSLTNVGTAGTYGSATQVPVITTDAQGRITGVTNTAINFPAEVDGVVGNEVTNATANGGLTRSGSGTSGSPYTLGLLTTCGDQQVLKYTLGTTTWGCANDNGTAYSAGTGISIVTGTISATLGTDIDSSEIVDGTIAAADLATTGASAGTYGDSGVNVTQLTVNNKGQVTSVSNRTLPTANGTTTGVLSSGDWTTFNGKENVLTFTGNGLFSRAGNTITGIAGTVSGQVLKWNGSAWATGTDNDTTYTNGTGLTLVGTTFSLTNDFGASIDSSEITNATIVAADVSADAFNFSEFSDSLTVDAATIITLGANNLTTNVNSTGTYAVQANGNTVLQVLNNGAVSIGNILSDQTIGVDNGTGTINIATDSDANTTNIGTGTGADTVNIGDANANVSITDANWSISGAGAANFASVSGAGLTSCNTQSSKLLWDSTTSQFSCGTDRASVSIRKSANETITSSTALQDDDQLLFAANTNETWIYEVSYIYTTGATATPDIRVGMNGPAGSTCVYQVADIAHAGNANAGSTACNTALSMATTATGTKGGYLTGSITTAATAGNVAFRWAQNTSSTTSTVVVAGSSLVAFKLTGADYAETYYTNDPGLAKGQLVELDGSGRSQVRKATQPYSDRVLGIVSTQPGQVVGEADGQGRPVQVALMGRVPIKLSTENGVPKAGDMITSSATLPGYGMKATRSGNVFGQLLVDATDNGDGTADGFVFVRNGYWQAPVSIDLAKIFGSEAMTNLGSADTSGLSVLGLNSEMAATYSGFDQAVVDEILRGFTLQQEQIKALDSRVSALESGSKEVPWLDVVSLLDTGALQFSGDVNFAGSAYFDKPIVNSSNTAGTVQLQPGQQQQFVTFSTPHTMQPKVILSPNNFVQGSWRVSGITTNGFVVELAQPQTETIEFTWQAITTQ